MPIFFRPAQKLFVDLPEAGTPSLQVAPVNQRVNSASAGPAKIGRDSTGIEEQESTSTGLSLPYRIALGLLFSTNVLSPGGVCGKICKVVNKFIANLQAGGSETGRLGGFVSR